MIEQQEEMRVDKEWFCDEFLEGDNLHIMNMLIEDSLIRAPARDIAVVTKYCQTSIPGSAPEKYN